MKIATMATGGIGGFLAVKLTKTGHQVATIARGAHLEAIRAKGLVLEGAGEREVVQPWMATDTPSEVGPVDVIVFGVKGDGLDAAARACLPMLVPQTVVIPFLNGVEACDRLLEILPAQNVANGVAKVSTTIKEPGVIAQTGQISSFIFAERDSRTTPRIAAFQAALNEAGADAPITDDVLRELWWKFALFSALSGITATARCTIGDITANADLSALFRAVVAETVALGQARGVALAPDTVDKIWAAICTMPPVFRASTAIDIEHGRPLEVEWVSGAVKRLAAESSVPAPLNGALYALLQPYRHGRRV